jgi:mannosyltransferase
MIRRSTAGYFLVTLTLVGAVLRLYSLDANSLWVDEVLTARAASLSFSDIMTDSIRTNSVPPFYFWLAHIAVTSFGESEATLRLVSALSGALTVPLFYLFILEISRHNPTSLVAAALLALNPLHLWFSQEARPYALLTMFECGAFLFFVRALERGHRGYWFAFTILLVMAFLSHSFAVTLLPLFWLWALLSERRNSMFRPMLLSTLSFALLTAPFAIALLLRNDVSHPPGRSSLLEFPYAIFSYLAGYSFGCPVREIQNLGATEAVRGNLIQTILGMATILALCAAFLWSSRIVGRWLPLLSLLPLVTVGILTRVTAFPFNLRYTLPSLLGFLGLIALVLCSRRTVTHTTLLLLVFGIFVCADAQWFLFPKYWKEDSRGAVGWLSAHLQSGSDVMVAPGYMTDPLTYYQEKLSPPHSLRFIEYEEAGLKNVQGLAVSREHHVVEPRKIEAAFAASGQGQPLMKEVVGFRLYARF